MRKLLLATIFALACGGGEDPTELVSVDPAFVGMWQLRTVNGQALPYVSQSGTSKVELQSGYISTGAAGTFVTQMNQSVTSGTTIKICGCTDYGYFVVEGGAATFHFTKAGTISSATLSHDTLTVLEGALTLALTR